MREIVLVGFAGGGGSCEGIREALGHSPHVALNHDPIAVGVHTVNHPETIHYCQNIYKAIPSEVLREVSRQLGEKVKIGLAWFSPDCKHFSKAKGAKPLRRNVRDLAWVVCDYWAKLPTDQRPRVIIMENVEEFQDWGPLDENQYPIAERKGETFKRFVAKLRGLHYKVEWRERVAADSGAPTTRKRLYLIARNDGLPIVWPQPTHGKPGTLHVISGKRAPWRTAAEIIDWSIPCPSIFMTREEARRYTERTGIKVNRPLAENTLARIARGIQRYVLDSANPFIVPVTHSGDSRVHGLDEPLRTITTMHRGEHALIAPTLINTRNGERIGQEPRTHDIRAPYPTVTAQGSQGALVTAFLAQHNSGMIGHDVREPVSTIVGKCCTQAVVSAGLVNLKGSERRQSAITDPAPTQCAGGWHIAEVRAFLMSYHRDGGQFAECGEPLPTADTRGRYGLVTVSIGGETYAIVDIGMRMLTPNELKRAMGVRDDYILDRMPDGSPVTKTAQIRLIGNMVCPPEAKALVGANYAEQIVDERGIPEFALQAAE